MSNFKNYSPEQLLFLNNQSACPIEYSLMLINWYIYAKKGTFIPNIESLNPYPEDKFIKMLNISITYFKQKLP